MLSRSTIRQNIPFLAIGGLYLDVKLDEEDDSKKLNWLEDIVLPCIDAKDYLSDKVLYSLRLTIDALREKVMQ